ncbi:MAG: flavin monoamine oxidase family protein [Acidimicrobiia bacterium]
MASAQSSGSTDDIMDVAIVGGGVSGVYSAYRLLTSEPDAGSPLAELAARRPNGKLRVGVYELSGHVGGRLLSAVPPGMPNTTVELGGMRYMSTHTYVKALVENKLRLRTRPFPVDVPENIAYVRGQRFRLGDLQSCGQPGGPVLPYNLGWSERGDPNYLLGNALNALIPGLTSMDPKTMWKTLKTVRVDGEHVYDYGLWNLVAKVMSYEAYTLARAIGGYDCLTMNYNAVDTAIESFEFVPGTTFSAFVDGFHEVPERLADMTSDEGGEVHLHKRLCSVTTERAGSGPVELTFADGTVVRAHKVILAMPRRSLELLNPVGPLFDPSNERVRSLLESVDGIPLFKVFTCYRYPWWEAAGVTQGRSLSDLPIRQTYYWGVEGRQDGSDPKSTNAVMLASYDDETNAAFWAGYRNKGADDLYENEESSPDKRWEAHQAPKGMVEEAHRQVMELHGTKYAPAPYAAAYRDWAEDPFGGAVHLWKIHQKSWEVIPQMIQPDETLPVYICGEAYSQHQTWVEGALETAEMVLQKKFGLAQPDWMHERAPVAGA